MAVYTTINDGTAYYQGLSYAGDGGTTAKTYTGNSNMQPDLCVGRKTSASGDSWYWVDSTRGASRSLMSDNSNQEDGYGIGSFNADGFTVVSSGNQNTNGQTYIKFGWKANGGTTASNSNGTITSTVQANTTAGFSIISYTGNGTNGATIGHGLSQTPQIFFPKCLSTDTNWEMYYFPTGGTKQYGYLNLTNAFATWSYTAPTSTTIGLSGSGDSNGNGRTMIGYAFHSVQGYSRIATYSGNGNVDLSLIHI